MAVISSMRYEVQEEPFERGGFGELYLARDRLFDQDVVLKTIAVPILGIREEEFRVQFFREALVGARLGQKTETIVKVLDLGYDESNDMPYFVMEKVSGGDLSGKAGSFTWQETVLLLRDALTALGAAHREGVVHSDVSPDNILYDPASQRYKLSDFGIAKLINSILLSRKEFSGLTGGKPTFIPPDQWASGKRTPYTDLYGLAVTVVQLMTGKFIGWLWNADGRGFSSPSRSDYFSDYNEHGEKIYDDTELIHDIAFDDQAHKLSLFAVESPAVDEMWYAHDGKPHRFWVELRRGDIIELVFSIIQRQVASADDAVRFLKDRTRKRLEIVEEDYRHKRAEEHFPPAMPKPGDVSIRRSQRRKDVTS